MLAQHGVDPGGRRASGGQFLDDAREQAEAELVAAEAARLQHAQDAGAMIAVDRFARDVAGGGGGGLAFDQRRNERAGLLEQRLGLAGRGG